MRKLPRFLFVLTILAAAALACQLSPASVNTNAASGDVIFKDDFSDKNGGWNSVSEDKGVTDYANGSYRIFVNTANYYLWSTPDNVSNLKDTHVEVDVTLTAGPQANDLGIICRYTDENNFYFFIIGTDGYYAVAEIKNGEENLIGMEKFQYDDTAIKSGNATNHLRADCVGDKLTLYVNGKSLVEVQNTDFTEGKVGLIAGTYDDAGTDASFDNFVVYKP